MEVKIPLERVRNLIPYPFTKKGCSNKGNNVSCYKNGITFIDNGDGSITANGTAEYSVYCRLTFDIPIRLHKGETYILSGCPDGGGQYSINCNCKSSFNGDIIGRISTTDENGTSINEKMDGNNIYSLMIRINKGTVLNDVIFRPQFESGSKTEFEEVQWKILSME